jgi:tetratricopeptide (TPR) repeat protein
MIQRGFCSIDRHLSSEPGTKIMQLFNTYLDFHKVALWWLVGALVLGMISGCVVQKVGGDLVATVKGDQYLAADDPKAGVEYFRQEVAADPENAMKNYYFGRMLLRTDDARAALPHLDKAAALEPANADYQFWLGVAYGALQKTRQERATYEKAIAIDPAHGQALTALGHSYLRGKQNGRALEVYDRALAVWPDNLSALYSRALALAGLGRKKQEREAWHRYLQVNTAGGLGRSAVERLNGLGDFSYRNYSIGPRTVSVQSLEFAGRTAELTDGAQRTLEHIGKIVQRMESGVLQVVVYQKGDAALAKARALAIRNQLLKEFPEIGIGRIGVSWFGEAQRIGKKKINIEESVDFFLTNQ